MQLHAKNRLCLQHRVTLKICRPKYNRLQGSVLLSRTSDLEQLFQTALLRADHPCVRALLGAAQGLKCRLGLRQSQSHFVFFSVRKRSRELIERPDEPSTRVLAFRGWRTYISTDGKLSSYPSVATSKRDTQTIVERLETGRRRPSGIVDRTEHLPHGLPVERRASTGQRLWRAFVCSCALSVQPLSTRDSGYVGLAQDTIHTGGLCLTAATGVLRCTSNISSLGFEATGSA